MIDRITNADVSNSALPIGKALLSDAVFRPMLFSTSMVKGIIKGSKIQTRRIIKPNIPFGNWEETYKKCPLKIGNIIWVKETYGYSKEGELHFAASVCNPKYDKPSNGWKPSLFMPKNVCRLFLEVENVTIERLQNISEDDAIAEGLETSIVKTSIFQTYLGYKNYYVHDAEDQLYYRCPIDSYKSLWVSINGSQSWQENPFVWVYSFKIIKCPYGFR